MPLILTLPFPDSRLMPNRKNGKHWTSTQSAKEEARRIGYAAGKEAMGAYWKPKEGVGLTLVFCPPDRRKRDLDNLHAAMKHYLDGVCAALEIDDSRFRPVLLDVGAIEKPGGVIVKIGVDHATI